MRDSAVRQASLGHAWERSQRDAREKPEFHCCTSETGATRGQAKWKQ